MKGLRAQNLTQNGAVRHNRFPIHGPEPVKEAWTRVGEYHFDNNELDAAIAAYGQVIQFKPILSTQRSAIIRGCKSFTKPSE